MTNNYEKILNELTDLDIMAIFPVGSCQWGCNNAKDTDYGVLLKEPMFTSTQKRWISGISADVYIHGDILNDVRPLHLVAYVKASQRDDIYGKLPPLKWEDVRKRVLKDSYSFCLSELNGLISYPKAYPTVSKYGYYLWLNYFAEINGNFDLTEEQRAQLQRIHDKQGTLQDLFDIKNKYEKLFEVETELLGD